MQAELTQNYYADSRAARYTALMIVCVGSFLIPVSMSAIPVVIPSMAADLSANAIYISWVPVSFLLANLIMLLPAGRLADVYGRKRILLMGFSLFVVSSLLAGLAQNIELLLFWRLFQGIAAAMFFSTGIAIVSSIFRDFGRGAALGWLVSSVYLGLLCGPLIGGVLDDYFGWRYAFYFVVLPGVVCVLLGIFKMKGEWYGERNRHFDWLGTLIVTVFVLCCFTGVSSLNTLTGQAGLVAAILSLAFFLRHCLRAEYPLIRPEIFRGRPLFYRSLFTAMLMYSASYAFVFVMALYFQFNRGLSATAAGQLLMVQGVFMVLLAPVSGRLSDRYPARVIASLGCFCNMAGFALLLGIDNTTPNAQILLALALLGLGFGLFSTPNSNAALSVLDDNYLGVGSALINQARLLGQMISSALAALFLSIYIGGEEIQPEQYDAFLGVVQSIVLCSLVLAALALLVSILRGTEPRAKNQPPESQEPHEG